MLHYDQLRILIVIVPLILLLLAFKRPIFAAIAYMIVIYGKTVHFYPIFSTLKIETVLPLIILFCFILDKSKIKRLSFFYNKYNFYFILLIFCFFLSYLFAWDHQFSWDYAIYHIVQMIFLVLFVTMTLNDERSLKLFVWSFVIFFAYLTYEPLYGYITKTGAVVEGYGDVWVSDIGLLSGHVALANNMNQMIPISLFLIFTLKNMNLRILAAIPLVFFFTGLIAAASRGGVLGFLFFGMVLVYFSKSKVKVSFVVAILTILIMLYSVTFFTTLQRVDRAQTHGRLSGIHHGINFVRFGHIFGVGPGCFMLARGHYHGHTMDAHNIYGQVIGELGIPGTIVWFLLIRQIFLNLSKSKQMLRDRRMKESFLYNLATGLQISLIVRLFVSLGSHGLYYFYWYIVGAMSVLIYQLSKECKLNKTNSQIENITYAK
jgi:O-antigen ligase